ncbi:hypothetical protein FJTKL_08289 [Diaporthe vaccinii]|uniref:C2H2-type domain-containing protein n=1 Tax=Diaporthe vaccinii TaxID=105482 RepID=A0ABR4EST0_9PEZI
MFSGLQGIPPTAGGARHPENYHHVNSYVDAHRTLCCEARISNEIEKSSMPTLWDTLFNILMMVPVDGAYWKTDRALGNQRLDRGDSPPDTTPPDRSYRDLEPDEPPIDQLLSGQEGPLTFTCPSEGCNVEGVHAGEYQIHLNRCHSTWEQECGKCGRHFPDVTTMEAHNAINSCLEDDVVDDAAGFFEEHLSCKEDGCSQKCDDKHRDRVAKNAADAADPLGAAIKKLKSDVLKQLQAPPDAAKGQQRCNTCLKLIKGHKAYLVHHQDTKGCKETGDILKSIDADMETAREKIREWLANQPTQAPRTQPRSSSTAEADDAEDGGSGPGPSTAMARKRRQREEDAGTAGRPSKRRRSVRGSPGSAGSTAGGDGDDGEADAMDVDVSASSNVSRLSIRSRRAREEDTDGMDFVGGEGKGKGKARG